jgi:hypothetical protein
MPKNTYFIKENYKKIEEVREIKSEIPSYEEFLKNYQADQEVSDSYENEIESYSDVGASKGFGPCYICRKDTQWTDLYIPCPVVGCNNRNLTYQTHSNGCGGNLEVSNKGQVRCKRCWAESYISNWNFSCSSHGGGGGGWLNGDSLKKALALALMMNNSNQVISDLSMFMIEHSNDW